MSPAPLTRPRAARWCPPTVAVSAAVLVTLLVLMFAGHQMSASDGHHAAGCAHAPGAGPLGAAGSFDEVSPGAGAVPTTALGAPGQAVLPGVVAGDGHAAPGDCSGYCGALLICTILLVAVIVAAGLVRRRPSAARPARTPRAGISLPVAFRGLAPAPDLVALGISRT
ncbi:hypothetical protein [Myceligenerans xiligouense]|uniref:Uncharacterized protein n=1 Tax=Myceligenerans xiligouense TaxID=253184 RepID=A0A3N4YPB9_9MICO|nr:hypothetical protein [Myceligenerans xiligouense]RPF21977.1 hypothetical protein EDD34_2620 [Myceligenerans xiligouense]